MSLPRSTLRLIVILPIVAILLGSSTLPPGDRVERVRAFTRAIEFDFVSWTLDALGVKLNQIALGAPVYLAGSSQRQAVLDYLELVRQIQSVENQINDVFADPGVTDPLASSAGLREELDRLLDRRDRLGPVTEAALQEQINRVLVDFGLTVGGQALPPVSYRTTSLPLALIISPREIIRQDADISLIPDLAVEERAALEDRVDQQLNVSSLVVPIGGIGLYPTMVMQTSDINWLAEVVAHEWIHNFLTLRPLGISFYRSPELRTMNETAASIAGKEIGRALIERYYPEYLPPPPPPPAESATGEENRDPPRFDFRSEMRTTRLRVDDLLAQGEVDEAEAYMEERRQFFWENGYHLRKLNQAYFAFHGAYADQPGGAAGDDPVGEAVRSLRAQSPTLAAFIKRISWMYSYQQLQAAVARNE